MKRKYVLVFSVLAIVAVVVHVCEANDKTLIYGESTAFSKLEPFTEDEVTARLMELMFDGLIGFDEKGQPVKELAKDWEISEDRKVYTFSLRKGIRWHGSTRQVSAYDVRDTFEHIRDEKTSSGWKEILDSVETIEAPNADTVKITLKYPVHAALGRLSLKIIPGSAINRSGKPIGTGSFMYYKRLNDSMIELRANKSDIHKPLIERIYARTFDDADITVLALMNRDIDLIPNYPINRLSTLDKDPGLRKRPYNLLSIACIAFNMRKDYFKDKDVRRAFSMVLDKEVLARSVYGGEGAAEVIWGPYPPTSAANYSKEYINSRYKGLIHGFEGIPEYNEAEASRLIEKVMRKKNSVKLPRTLSLKAPKISKGNISYISTISLHYMNAIKQAFDVDLKIEYEPLDRFRWKEDIFEKHDFDMTYIEWSFGDLMDIKPLFHSSHTGKGQKNIVGYKSDRVDQLLDDSSVASPEALIDNIYPELFAIIGDDCPYVFLWSTIRYTGYNKKVVLGKIDPFNFFEFIDKFYIDE